MSTPHKHAEVIKAWADGATIQYQNLKVMQQDQWVEYGGNRPQWHEEKEWNYRIKPPREFPTTSLSDKVLYDITNMVWQKATPGEVPLTIAYRAHRAVADAAIKQYIMDTEAKK